MAVHRNGVVRGHPQSVGSFLYARRQQRWQRCGGGCRSGAIRVGFRRRGIDPNTGRLVRPVRPQAATRPGADCTARRRLVRTECQRPVDSDRCRCRTLPGRNQHREGSPRGGRQSRGTQTGPVANCGERQATSDHGGSGRPGAAESPRRGRETPPRTRPRGLLAGSGLSGLGALRPCSASDVARGIRGRAEVAVPGTVGTPDEGGRPPRRIDLRQPA